MSYLTSQHTRTVQDSITLKCKEHAKDYAEYTKSNEAGIYLPYNRHQGIRDEEERLLAVLGGIGDNVNFVETTFQFSMNKLQKKKRNEETPDEEEETQAQNPMQRKARLEWLSFLKVWVNDSQLFHPDYPKSFHRNHYILRIRKLAYIVYDYLHENCLVYQLIKSDVERRVNDGEDVYAIDWMDGQWFPTANQIDPACETDDPSTSLFFPVDGKLTKFFSILC